MRSFTDAHYTTSVLPQLRILKTKHRDGFVDRIVDDHYVLGRGLFKRETNMAAFIGLTVRLPSGAPDTLLPADALVPPNTAAKNGYGWPQARPARSSRRLGRAASSRSTSPAVCRPGSHSCWQPRSPGRTACGSRQPCASPSSALCSTQKSGCSPRDPTKPAYYCQGFRREKEPGGPVHGAMEQNQTS